MEKHYIHVYNIGQGLCTMLRTEPDGENDYLGIFDCGTLRERNREDVTNTIVAYAQEYEHIDSIVISHQDNDHWSLLLDIIWKFYEVTGDNIICQNDFYFKKTREETIIYEALGDKVIEYSSVKEGIGYNCDFSVVVDGNENIQRFELNRMVEKSPQIGVCHFKLSWSNDSKEISLYVFIGDVLVETEEGSGDYQLEKYKNTFPIPVPWKETFCSNEWQRLKKFIGEQGIYEEIQEMFHNDRNVEVRWNRFLDNIDEFKNKFTYNIMKKKLSCSTNYNNENRYIGKIWLGGNGWEIGYRRLFYMLKKLVKIGLINNVNGFTSDSSMDSGTNIRICGLMQVNESTICSDDVSISTFDIDENLEDCISHKVGDITPAIVHNASSLIVEFDTSTEAKSRRIIYPGDATVHVFSDLANALDGPEIFENTFFMAPHHGSLHTNYCDGEQQPFYQLLDKLTGEKTVKLSACVISALGEVFGHPNKKFVYDMREYVRTDNPKVPPHSVCYFEEGLKRIENETKGIYCTEMMRAIGRRWHSEPPEQANAVRKEQRRLLPGKNAFV